jgi:hypothetical protein
MIVSFLLPILTGAMLVHLLWSERDIKILFFKAFLGMGLGLGVWSLLYFFYLSFFAGQHWFIVIQLLVFLCLLVLTIWREKKRGWDFLPHPEPWRPTIGQGLLVGVSCAVFVISLSSTASYLLRRRQGDWDAWMMFNRSARFIYRGQAGWRDAFSIQMDRIFHPDYPPLLALNIASVWDALGRDNSRVPMLQSALFSIASVGLMVGALASVKSWGQAGLGLLFLWGIPAFVNEGAREMADVPLAFFVLATAILIYLYVLHKKLGLIALAGCTAGLAAWTKNEGSVFVIGTTLALAIAFFREKSPRLLLSFAAGLSIPLGCVLYFKSFLAPPSDLLSGGLAQSIQKALDLARHTEIIRYFWSEIIGFGSWGIPWIALGIIPVLLVYYIVFRSPVSVDQKPAYLAGIILLFVQAFGVYGIYLITPYDLTWHLDYSLHRVFIQMYPMITFLILCACRMPESVF